MGEFLKGYGVKMVDWEGSWRVIVRMAILAALLGRATKRNYDEAICGA